MTPLGTHGTGHAEFVFPLGGQHHEDQEDQQDARGDGELREEQEDAAECRADVVGGLERLLLDRRHLQAGALEKGLERGDYGV